MDETVKPEKVKMVFVGGKKAPTGYRIGEVVLLRKRYLSKPWFEPLPEGKDANIGDLVSLAQIPGAKTKVRVKMPRRLPGNPALLDVEGKFRMRFRNNVSGVPIKNAPGTFIHGETYELSLRHSNYPWFELLEDAGVIIVPPSGPEESNYEDEGGIFVPPEAVDEETDFDELKIEPEKPGPYTPEELVAQMKKQRDLKAAKNDFADADEEERETGLLKAEKSEHLEPGTTYMVAPEDPNAPKVDDEIDPDKVVKIVNIEKEEPESELTPEEEAYLEEEYKEYLSPVMKEEAIKSLRLPTESEIEKMNKIGLVTFIKEHDGAANMRMKREDLLDAALSILNGLED